MKPDITKGLNMNKSCRKEVSENMTSIFQPKCLIRIEVMIKLLNCSRTTLYRWVKNGFFPEPRMRAGRTLGWTLSQYEQWLAAQ